MKNNKKLNNFKDIKTEKYSIYINEIYKKNLTI